MKQRLLFVVLHTVWFLWWLMSPMLALVWRGLTRVGRFIAHLTQFTDGEVLKAAWMVVHWVQRWSGVISYQLAFICFWATVVGWGLRGLLDINPINTPLCVMNATLYYRDVRRAREAVQKWDGQRIPPSTMIYYALSYRLAMLLVFALMCLPLMLLANLGALSLIEMLDWAMVFGGAVAGTYAMAVVPLPPPQNVADLKPVFEGA